MKYPLAMIGSLVALLLAFLIERLGSAWIGRRIASREQQTWTRSNLRFVVSLCCVIILALLWVRLFQNKGTLFGVLAAGLAIALREPLLSLAGRLSIWIGRLYRVGDRIEFDSMAGDVVQIGIFYTRMLEIGNWVHADQATGRLIHFPNAMVYQKSLLNYTQTLRFIWDEIMLPVTYASDIEAARQLLLQAGDEVTQAIAASAQTDISAASQHLLLPDLSVMPRVFTEVTSNYVALTLRYVVAPRHRRQVRSEIFSRVFDLVQQNGRVDIGSDTMDLTVHPPARKAPRKGARTQDRIERG